MWALPPTRAISRTPPQRPSIVVRSKRASDGCSIRKADSRTSVPSLDAMATSTSV